MLAAPCCQAGTWYMDRKNEVPAGKENYFVLPIVNWHKVSRPAAAHVQHAVPPLTFSC